MTIDVVRSYTDRIIPLVLVVLFLSLGISKAGVEISLGVLMGFSLLYLVQIRDQFVRYKYVVAAILCFSAVVFMSDARLGVWRAAVPAGRVCYFLVTPVVVAWFIGAFNAQKKCLVALSVSFLVVAIFILEERVLLGSLRPDLLGNAVGTAYKLAFGIVCGLFMLEDSARRKYSRAILVALCGGALMVLQTRGALVASFVVVLYFLFQKIGAIKRDRKTLLVIVAAGVASVVLYTAFFGQRMLEIRNNLEQAGQGDLFTSSVGQRLYMWKKSYYMFTDNIVTGIGYSRWPAEFKAIADAENLPAHFPRFNQPHNFIVDLASTTGVLGIISYVMVLISPLYYLWRSRTLVTLNAAHMDTVYASLLLMFVVLGMFDSITRMHSPYKIFVMLLAVLLSYGSNTPLRDGPVSRRDSHESNK